MVEQVASERGGRVVQFLIAHLVSNFGFVVQKRPSDLVSVNMKRIKNNQMKAYIGKHIGYHYEMDYLIGGFLRPAAQGVDDCAATRPQGRFLRGGYLSRCQLHGNKIVQVDGNLN
jgi:hypothetical protein